MTEATTLFTAEYGSRAYGTATENSDRDYISVLIEPRTYITGLLDFRAVHESTAEKGERSTKDDTDTLYYGLRKFAGLAVAGNPQVMATLFLSKYEEFHPLAQTLIDSRDACVSKRSGEKYLGYMRSQRYNLEGLKKGKTNRPELVHKFGYDTKFAYHAARLAYQGIELMITGEIQMPMADWAIETCMEIRNGEMSKDECIEHLYGLDAELVEAIENSSLPQEGNPAKMSKALHSIYMDVWAKEDEARWNDDWGL